MKRLLYLFTVLFLFHLLTPWWWWVMAVPFLDAFWRGRSVGGEFLIGGASAGVLWFLAGLYEVLLDGRIIAERVADLLTLGSPWLVLAATAVVAGMSAAAAGAAGYSLRALFSGD